MNHKWRRDVKQKPHSDRPRVYVVAIAAAVLLIVAARIYAS